VRAEFFVDGIEQFVAGELSFDEPLAHVGLGFEPEVVVDIEGGGDDDGEGGELAVLLEVFEEAKAVEAGEGQVEDDQVDGHGFEDGQAAPGVVGAEDLLAVGAEKGGHGVAVGGGVIDDENGGHGVYFLFNGGLSKWCSGKLRRGVPVGPQCYQV
jgi:hypothetical protein